MNRKELISVIIAVYNGEDFLERCLQSLEATYYKELEIIIVDDGSSDKSVEIYNRYAQRDERIIVIYQENQGVSAARNKGIMASSGKYITFLDADDYVDKEIYNIATNHFTEDVDMVGFNSFKCSETGERLKKISDLNREYITNTSSDALVNFLYPKVSYAVWSKLFRRNILFNQEGTLQICFDESIGIHEDLLFVCEYIVCCGGRIKQISNHLYYYVLRQDSVGRKEISDKTFSVIKTFEKIFDICTMISEECLEAAQIKYCEEMINIYRKIVIQKHYKKSQIKIIKNEIRKYFWKYQQSKKVVWKRKVYGILMIYLPYITAYAIYVIQWLMSKRKKIF